MTKKQLDTLKTVVSADITVFIIWSNWNSYQFTQLLLLLLLLFFDKWLGFTSNSLRCSCPLMVDSLIFHAMRGAEVQRET